MIFVYGILVIVAIAAIGTAIAFIREGDIGELIHFLTRGVVIATILAIALIAIFWIGAIGLNLTIGN